MEQNSVAKYMAEKYLLREIGPFHNPRKLRWRALVYMILIFPSMEKLRHHILISKMNELMGLSEYSVIEGRESLEGHPEEHGCLPQTMCG